MPWLECPHEFPRIPFLWRFDMRLSVRCLTVLAIAILIPGLAAAQTEFGKLTGTVTDLSRRGPSPE